MKVIRIFMCYVLLSISSSLAHAAYYSEDSWESGDMSAPNTSGFSWEKNNGTYVFDADGMVFVGGEHYDSVTSSPTPGLWSENADSNWVTGVKSGSHSLNILYRSDKQWAEQRFQLGKALPEVWIRYWVRVPHNFSAFDCEAGGPTNNKWFAIWQDGYSAGGEGSTAWWGWHPDGTGGKNAVLDMSISPGCNTNAGNKKSSCGFGEDGHKKLLIRHPEDQGRWMQMVLYLKQESYSPTDNSTPGSHDGVMRTWQRWENESDFTLIHDVRNLGLRAAPGVNGWTRGYMMGHMNSGVCEQTEWRIDDFTVSDRPLIDVEILADPKPPSNLR